MKDIYHTSLGDFIGTQLIFTGSTICCLPKEAMQHLLYSKSKSHWQTVDTLQELFVHGNSRMEKSID